MGVTVRKNWNPARTSRRKHGCGDHGIAFAGSLARRSTALQGAFSMFSHRAIGPLMLLSLLAIGLGTTDAYAHARWFIDDTQIVLHPEFKFDGLYLAMLVGAVLFVAAALTLEMARARIPFLNRWLSRSLLPTLLLWRLVAMVF